MAITVRCLNCKTDSKLNTKKCRKCRKPLSPKNRRYRAVVKMPNGKWLSKMVDTVETS